MIFLSESLIEDEVNALLKTAMQEPTSISRCSCDGCDAFKKELNIYYKSLDDVEVIEQIPISGKPKNKEDEDAILPGFEVNIVGKFSKDNPCLEAKKERDARISELEKKIQSEQVKDKEKLKEKLTTLMSAPLGRPEKCRCANCQKVKNKEDEQNKKDEEKIKELRAKHPCQNNIRDIFLKINEAFGKIRKLDNYDSKISKYIDNIKSNVPGLKVNEGEILKDFHKKINNLEQARHIAEDGYREIIVGGAKKDFFWIFSVLKNIRDLLIQDIDIKGKKEVESYFPIYSKIFKENLDEIASIIERCQSGMLLCYRRPNIANDFQSIIFEKDHQINSPLTQQDKLMQAMDQQSPMGNLMFSSAVHSIQSGASITSKKIDKAHYLPPALNKGAAKKNLPLLNEIFDTLKINFSGVEDLEEKKLKLKLYTELTGDNEVTFPFNRLVNEIIAYKERGRGKPGAQVSSDEEEVQAAPKAPEPESPTNPGESNPETLVDDTAKDESKKAAAAKLKKQNKINQYLGSNSYNEIKEKKDKLKIIISLKFNQRTIETLQNYKIVQSGDCAKLMEDPGSRSLPNLNEEELKKFTKISYRININYFLESLGSEIDNLLFKTN
jgi:hypothetical protein